MTSSRLLSGYYDSVRQRGYRALLKEQSRVQNILRGRLRFDTLLSQRLVITDAMLLDGEYFLNLGPDKILRDLRRCDDDDPIEIVARAERLDDALVGFVKGDESLKGFSFSAIQDSKKRKEVTSELKKIPSKNVRKWQDIPQVLTSLGVDSVDVAVVEASWSKWIEAQNQGLLRVAKWDAGKWNLGAQLGGAEKIKERLQTEAGKMTLGGVCRIRDSRSDVDVLLDSAKKRAKNERPANELDDLVAIEAWYHRGYRKALAVQHGADNYEELDSSSWRINHDQREYEGFTDSNLVSSLPCDERLIYYLGELPGGEYQRLFFNSKIHFERWWSDRDMDSLKRGLGPFTEAAFTAHGEPPTFSGHEKVAIDLGAGAAGLAAGLAAGGFIGSYVGFILAGADGILKGAEVGAGVGGYVMSEASKLCAESYMTRRANKPVDRLLERVVAIAKERHHASK
jgi:hypothetical protein